MSLDTHVDVPWQPLNSSKSEIRVLEISPALSQSDSIICHLQTLSLLDEPEYEALSYVWGISSESRKIILNGKALIVTDNLFKALTHLRDVNKTRTLWVDAVCINQKDDIEKNVQVMMMDKIYSKASRVLVWLMENDSYLISDHIASFSRDQNRHLTKYPLSLWALSKIDWWRRAWTFQEAALANNLVFYIGEEYFTIEHFEAYRHSMYQHLFRPNACCSHILRQGPLHPKEYGTALEALQQLLKIRKLLSKGKKDLLNLITVNKDRLASNPRDKVYAYLGLACDAPAELVKYELPLKECIIYITTKLIQHNMSLEAIRHASPSGIFGDDEERMAELPSWCPDWTRSTKRRISFTTQSQFDRLYQRFSASSHTKAKIFFPTAEILGVSGVLCDTVTHVGHGEPGIWGPGSDPKILLQWCYLAAHSTSVHNARCDECDKIIYGVRNKCLSCSDFDLCSRCFRISGNIHPGHTFTCIQSSSLMLKDNSNNQDMYKAPDIVITERENGYHVQGSSWETLSEMDYPFNNSDTMQDAFRKVLISDTPVLTIRSNDMENGSRADPILQDIAFAEYWSRKVEKRPAVAIPAKEGYAEDQVISILSELTNEHIFIVKDTINLVLMGKRMFVSSKGYIGWGPDELMAGDTVAVLNGSSMPFILRAVPEQQTKAGFDSGYTLVGECYAHGLMNGEALEDAEMEKRDILLY